MSGLCLRPLRLTSLREVSLRRNAPVAHCQHLAKIYDSAHPRAKNK